MVLFLDVLYVVDGLASFFICSRYLKTKNREDVLLSPEFKLAQKAVKSKTKDLVKMGKGKKPHSATELTPVEEERLWQCGELGVHRPESLFNGVWLIIHQLFILKKVKFDIAEKCLWGDVTLERNANGWEYLELHGRETKSITGENFGDENLRPKAWAKLRDPARCPVEMYKKFREKRHPNSLLPLSPFFVAIEKGNKTQPYWFKNKSVGRNTVRNVLGEMARRAGIPGKKTIKSLQRTGGGIPFFSTFQS